MVFTAGQEIDNPMSHGSGDGEAENFLNKDTVVNQVKCLLVIEEIEDSSSCTRAVCGFQPLMKHRCQGLSCR